MMRWMVLVAALAVVGPAGAFEDVDGSLAKVPEKQRAELIRLLDLNVPDGTTARLREVKQLKFSEDQLCGVVNSKNGAGAYSGFRPFVANFRFNMLWVEGSAMDPKIAQVFKSNYSDLCKD